MLFKSNLIYGKATQQIIFMSGVNKMGSRFCRYSSVVQWRDLEHVVGVPGDPDPEQLVLAGRGQQTPAHAELAAPHRAAVTRTHLLRHTYTSNINHLHLPRRAQL